MDPSKFRYEDDEPVWDDEQLRDYATSSFYFHFSQEDAVMVFIALAALTPNTSQLPAMQRFKQQMANQGIDWKLMSELRKADAA